MFYCSTDVSRNNLEETQITPSVSQSQHIFLTQSSVHNMFLGRLAPTSQLQADPLINFCQLCPLFHWFLPKVRLASKYYDIQSTRANLLTRFLGRTI